MVGRAVDWSDVEMGAARPGTRRSLVACAALCPPETIGLADISDAAVTGVALRARRPLHPRRWERFVEDVIPRLAAARGVLWLAHDHDFLYTAHKEAAGAFTLTRMGLWFVARSSTEWPHEREAVREICAAWQSPFGDRRQSVLFVPRSVQCSYVTHRFEQCLLEDGELAPGPRAWADAEASVDGGSTSAVTAP